MTPFAPSSPMELESLLFIPLIIILETNKLTGFFKIPILKKFPSQIVLFFKVSWCGVSTATLNQNNTFVLSPSIRSSLNFSMKIGKTVLSQSRKLTTSFSIDRCQLKKSWAWKRETKSFRSVLTSICKTTVKNI